MLSLFLSSYLYISRTHALYVYSLFTNQGPSGGIYMRNNIMVIRNNEWSNSIECPGSHYKQPYAKRFINTVKYMCKIYTFSYARSYMNNVAIRKQGGLKTESTKGRCLHSQSNWPTCTRSVQASMLIRYITTTPLLK